MFDLTYYKELNELITLEYEQEDLYNYIRQNRVHHFSKKEKTDTELTYLRYRFLQEKHQNYFNWFYHNFILLNRTREARYSLITEQTRIAPLSYRRIVRNIE